MVSGEEVGRTGVWVARILLLLKKSLQNSIEITDLSFVKFMECMEHSDEVDEMRRSM